MCIRDRRSSRGLRHLLSFGPMPELPSPAGVAGIAKRPLWPVPPVVAFAVALTGLLVVAVISFFLPKHHPHGLPEDAALRAAEADVSGRVSVRTNMLRWRAELLG